MIEPLPPALSMREHLAAALRDLGRSFEDWRMWLVLGLSDIRQRYQRSRIGQFWITLSMLVTIAVLGVVYSYLFRLPIQEYLPFLAMGIIVWGLISAFVTEACQTFTGAEGYLRQAPMAKSVFVHRMLVRNLVIFAHNIAIIPLLYLAFGIFPGWPLLLAPVGLVLVTVNGFWVGLLLGTLCARFRDLPQIVGSLMQIAFFITPVMWRPDQLPNDVSWLMVMNPLASLLSVVRDPLLGIVPDTSSYFVASGTTVAGLLIAVPFFARFRARIIYWL
jgi:ABC-type polysaccharide/polyol phosphate export permease